MRVTQNGVVDNLLAELNKNRAKYSSLSQQLATQKRVNLPSDDALAFGNGEEKKSLIQRNEQFQSNLDNGIEQARVADETITLIMEQFYDLKALATRGANGSANSDGDLEILADNVASIRTKLVQLANVQAAGRYLFSGTQTQTPAFTATNTTVTYNGNTQELSIKANPTTSVPVSVNGESLFTYAGETVFDLLSRIETSMRNNDTNAINADLASIDAAVEHVARQGSRVGNAINQMEFAYEQFEGTNITLRGQVSRLLDADYAETASKLQQLDIAYNAALAVTSRMSQLSLLNYL